MSEKVNYGWLKDYDGNKFIPVGHSELIYDGDGKTVEERLTALEGEMDSVQAQDSFKNIKVGDTTIEADQAEDTLELAEGSGIALTPDATNDKVTISHSNQVTAKTSYSQNNNANKSGDKFTITEVKYDTEGHITGSQEKTITLPSDISGNAATATRLETPVNITITDSNGNNGNTTSLIGNTDITLDLPDTITANIEGKDGEYFFIDRENNVIAKISESGIETTNVFSSKTSLNDLKEAFDEFANDVITEVAAGDGLAGGGSNGNVTLNVVTDRGLSVANDKVGHSTTGGADVAQTAGKAVTKLDIDAYGHVTGTDTSDIINSITVSGSGNAITAASNTNGAVTLTKGATFKTQQEAVDDPTASGTATAFIDSISQNANGEITVTKKNITTSDLGGIDTVTATGTAPLTLKAEKTGTSVAITGSIAAAGTDLGTVKSGGDVTISNGTIIVNDDSHNHIIGNVDGLQSALDSKQPNLTGAATTIASSNLTASRVVVSNASGKIAASDITATELNQLDGVTGNVQNQLKQKYYDVEPGSTEGSIKLISEAGSEEVTVNGLGHTGDGKYYFVDNSTDPKVTAFIDGTGVHSQEFRIPEGAKDGGDITLSGLYADTEAVQAQLDATKWAVSTSVGGPAISANKVNAALTVGTKTFDGSKPITITPSDLGLAQAMKFLGTSKTEITDGATTDSITIGSTSITVTAGNVVLYGAKEFVWTGTEWEELGNEGSYKIVQNAVADPAASGTSVTFIDTISQDTNGNITPTKKTVGVNRGLDIDSDDKIGHSNSVTAKTTYQSADASGSGASFKLTEVLYDAQGHITESQTKTVTMPSSVTGNAGTADRWKTARNISIADSSKTNTGTAVSVDGSENETLLLPATIKATLTGNADTATKLKTARTINGTSFNGSANITTAKWGTARKVSITDGHGNIGTPVSVDGSADVSLDLPDTIKADLIGNITTTDDNYSFIDTKNNVLAIIQNGGIKTVDVFDKNNNALSTAVQTVKSSDVTSTTTVAGINMGDSRSGNNVTISGTVAAATTTTAGAMTAADKIKLDGIAIGAEVNQNAFSYVKVDSTTIEADSKKDTLELVASSNVTITPDSTNDKVTISALDEKVKNEKATTTKAYLTGTTSSSTNTGTQVFDTGVYLTETAGQLHIDNSLDIGSNNTLSNSGLAIGSFNTVSGNRSMATGYGNIASGQYSLAQGYKTQAQGKYSFAGGTAALSGGENSFAFGKGLLVTGKGAIGIGTSVQKTIYLSGSGTSYSLYKKSYTQQSSVSGQILSTGAINYTETPSTAYIQYGSGSSSSPSATVASTRTVYQSVIYTLVPGYKYYIDPNTSNAYLFSKYTGDSLNGSLSFSNYIIDRTTATTNAYLTALISTKNYQLTYRYSERRQTGTNTYTYYYYYQWQASSGTTNNSSPPYYYILNTTALPTNSYIVGSQGLVKIISQTDSTITTDKILTESNVTTAQYALLDSEVAISGSHAIGLGYGNVVSASHGVALGYLNTSTGNSGTAIGIGNEAKGDYSVAIGYYNDANTRGSTALGYHNIADANYSTSLGYYTQASSQYQTTIGKYNIIDSENKYALIIGNGSSSTRSNAYTLDWSGNAVFSGNVTANTLIGNANTADVWKSEREFKITDGHGHYSDAVKVNGSTNIDLDLPDTIEVDLIGNIVGKDAEYFFIDTAEPTPNVIAKISAEGINTTNVTSSKTSLNDLKDEFDEFANTVVTEVVNGTGINYSRDSSKITISHADTSSANTIAAADGKAISNITIDKFGHITSMGTGNVVNTISVTGTGNAITAASVSNGTLTLTKGATYNNYSLPLATSTVRGGVKVGYTTDADNCKYAVQLDNEKMYVNVPWKDTWLANGVGVNGFVTGTKTTDANLVWKTNDEGVPGWRTDDNTTYSNMKGATSSAAGSAGLVPAPAAGKETSFLRGDGTWVVPTDTIYTLPAASTSALGGIKVSSKNSSAVTVNSESTTEGRYYPIELNSDNKAIVNVPWKNTTYTFTNKDVTLAWGTESTIATVGGTDITVTMPANPNTNTKNTAGATDTSSLIYIVGAKTQDTNPQTYTHDTVWINASGNIVVSDTESAGQKAVFVSNKNGQVSLLTHTNRGLYDTGEDQWMVYRLKDSNVTLLPNDVGLPNSYGTAATMEGKTDCVVGQIFFVTT